MKTTTLLVGLGLLVPSMMQAASTSYFLDDGTGESGLGGYGTTTVWLNSFTSQAGAEYIQKVSISFGGSGANPTTYNGMAFGVHVWSDPNNDGNPDDAVLLESGSGVISDFSNTSNGASTGFVEFTLDSAAYIASGNSFFVGMSMYFNQNVLGPARDTSSNEGRSWMYRWNGDVANSAPGSMSTALNKNNYDDILGGNAMIRAEGVSSVPEPSSSVLFGLTGAIGLMRRKRS
ncbi:PEP-CTERM protein-sorting domain-containing protein [Rubritalea squalenifaciens DSM 18772]|uniref:PEP-CTERM protein-sorting domain-containing protein n=1 Tax=Rubritalea squalenifaciens DSM 18772 TaxID=1123071 RepID=A0A1M6KML6_9BACT|nr:PEP-CTERM sorting domain-containing protein [Rubritalea squalenifaciens]SHJ60181.1 PEP-CTERM protein-sorting domain-containing protein [Rubritalea squalenifaciens DSM 18772]